jgi:hypothetical protein
MNAFKNLTSWPMWQLLLAGAATLGMVAGFQGCPLPRRAIALTEETFFLLTVPLEAELLDSRELPSDSRVVTPFTISQTSITIPSLWWAEEQFGGKLLDTWLAYPGGDADPARVDLVVNNPVWNAANYVQRYTFLRHFGLTAQDFGYSVRVFNRQQELLGAYICADVKEPGAEVPEPVCNVFLESGGRGALSGGSANPFAAP